jgi:hypothetical protein
MAKKQAQRSQHHGRKEFELEDARRMLVMRHFAIVIEKKLLEIVAADDRKGGTKRYADAIKATKDYLAELDEIKPTPTGHSASGDCWDDYEDCGGGVCKPWCS